MKKLILFSLLCILLFPLCSFAANDGTPYGGVTFGEPKYGSASASFDGVDDYIKVPHDESLNFGTGDFTIEGWFKTPIVNSGNVIGKIVSATSVGWGIYFDAFPARVMFYVGDEVFGNDVYYGFDYTAKFIHFCAVKDGTFIKLYIDGELKAEVNLGGNPNVSNTTDVLLGSFEITGGYYFNGSIDEVAIYNIALSPETITSHFNSINYQVDVSNTPGLVSYWRFDNDFLDAPVSSVPLSDSELLQQIKDVLDQIDAKTQAIKDVTAGSTAVDWNKTMSFVAGTLSSLAFVFASRMIL